MGKHAYGDQRIKPIKAAKRLGIYLPAAPADFQEHSLTRAEIEELEKNPPPWLSELRQNGPHPRPVVAKRLGVSIGGLARGGITEPLTTAQIDELRDDLPDWLVHEREVAAQLRNEKNPPA